MKYIISIILVLITLPLSSEIKFEEVFQVYPEGEVAVSPKLYFNGDSILIRSETIREGDKKYRMHYFLSTNNGEDWDKITDKVTRNFRDITEIHGSYLFFVTRDLSSDVDTTFYYLDIEGNVIKKVTTPFNFNNYKFVLHPRDKDFIALYYDIYDEHHKTHYQVFNYSTDRGDTWHGVNPEKALIERGVNFIYTGREILTYTFNRRNKDLSAFVFKWWDNHDIAYGTRFIFNFKTKEVSFLESEKPIGYFGLFGEMTGAKSTDGYDSLEVIDYETLESYFIPVFDKTIKMDPDSVSQNNDDGNPPAYTQKLLYRGYGANSANLDHHFTSFLHYEKDTSETPEYTFIHQYYFHSLDAGKTWSLLLKNEDKYYLINGLYINPNDNRLWMVKGYDSVLRHTPHTRLPHIYRSLGSVLNVKSKSESNNIKAHFTTEKLIIENNENAFNSRIEIFNLQGKRILSIDRTLKNGRNEIERGKLSDEQLYIIRIGGDGKGDSIFKLIKNN